MEYRFLSRSDEDLIETSELPHDGGIAIALQTTGYELGRDEIVRVAVTSLDGSVLFDHIVKPQNIETWEPGDTSGGIAPADVADAPELFQFEEELSDLFENASVVVGEHLPFIEAMVESSWVTLPAFGGFDLTDRFVQSHSTTDYPGEPATAAALSGIASYYGIDAAAATPGSDPAQTAALVAACYRRLVEEHADERASKGDAYWERYRQRLAEEEARDAASAANHRLREKRMNQINGLMWIAGGLIFTSLAIQLTQRGGDAGFIILCVAAAVFTIVQGIRSFRR